MGQNDAFDQPKRKPKVKAGGPGQTVQDGNRQDVDQKTIHQPGRGADHAADQLVQRPQRRRVAEPVGNDGPAKRDLPGAEREGATIKRLDHHCKVPCRHPVEQPSAQEGDHQNPQRKADGPAPKPGGSRVRLHPQASQDSADPGTGARGHDQSNGNRQIDQRAQQDEGPRPDHKTQCPENTELPHGSHLAS